MIAVITGDIVASRKMPDKKQWLRRLKEVIEKKSGLSKTPRWTMFRGDGFQVEVVNPAEAFRLVLLIRSGLKSIPEFNALKLDARMGIGIGERGFHAKSLSESDGPAYQLSGAVLDGLHGTDRKLEVRTPWPDFDENMNLILSLASVIIDDWSQPSAEIAWISLSSSLTQKKIAKQLFISQPAVNKRFAHSHIKEINTVLAYYEKHVAMRLPKK